MKRRRVRLTHRLNGNSNGFWSDISAGEFVDTRFQMRRGVSQRMLASVSVLAVALFSVGGWLLYDDNEKDVDPSFLASKLEKSVFEVYCGDGVGTAFALDFELPEPYETAFASAAHVFEDCRVGDEVTMRGSSGYFVAELLAKTASSRFLENPSAAPDVALLGGRFFAPTLKHAKNIQRGDWAVAMGYPWGQDQYFSLGVVSDLNQTEIFVDTPLNQGNSGGPIVNNKGEVIGIASYKPVQRDIFSEDPDLETGDIYRADGIAALKRLSNLCSLPRQIMPNCPFKG